MAGGEGFEPLTLNLGGWRSLLAHFLVQSLIIFVGCCGCGVYGWQGSFEGFFNARYPSGFLDEPNSDFSTCLGAFKQHPEKPFRHKPPPKRKTAKIQAQRPF